MTEAEAMETDVEALRAWINYSADFNPKLAANKPDALAKLTRISDLLQRYEDALRFYAKSSDNYMTAQAALAGMTKEEFRAAEARRDAATQETGE